MNSSYYEIQLIAKSPFVKFLTLSVIRNILKQKISYEERHIIDTELVPRISSRVAFATLKEGRTEKIDARLINPIQVVPQTRQHYQHSSPIMHRTNLPVLQRARAVLMNAPIVAGHTEIIGNYGKITPLLHDASVSTIECPGPDKPITIIRAGQMQFTKITLNQKEIKDVFEEIAEQARVPLIEGVFKASVENFSISGVVSEMIGSRFVIKKQTPYALLEGGTN